MKKYIKILVVGGLLQDTIDMHNSTILLFKKSSETENLKN